MSRGGGRVSAGFPEELWNRKGQCPECQHLSSSMGSSEQAGRAGPWEMSCWERLLYHYTGSTNFRRCHPCWSWKLSTKCRWGCCYTEEEAASTAHVFCRGNCPSVVQESPSLVWESWLGANLGSLNSCSRISGDVLKVVQSLVAWHQTTNSGVCALPSWEWGDRDTTPVGAPYSKKSNSILKLVISATTSHSNSQLCI